MEKNIVSLAQVKYYLPVLLILATALLMTQSFELGMAGLTTFLLAYLSKGIRVKR